MFLFMIRFLICNIYLCGVIGILFLLKHICRKTLPPRRQYQIWLLFLCLLAVPFLPFSLKGIWEWVPTLGNSFLFSKTTAVPTSNIGETKDFALNFANDFAVSVNQDSDSFLGWFLASIWLCGMIIAAIKLCRSYLHLRSLEKSALPVQNDNVCQLFVSCLQECGITKEIPIFSTAFLRTPILVGVWKPRIYIPISIMNDSSEGDLRLIMMHELAHEKHKDNLVNHFINLAGIVYWFHPFVSFAFKEMRSIQEIACDEAVLEMLDNPQYLEYGNTLLRFAERNALETFPAAASLINSKKQMKRRILHIVQYEMPTKKKQRKSMCILIELLQFVRTV